MKKKKEELPGVRVKWDRARPARLLYRGAEASEIKWLDTGVLQVIPNNQLDFLNEKRENRKREK